MVNARKIVQRSQKLIYFTTGLKRVYMLFVSKKDVIFYAGEMSVCMHSS